VNRKAEIAEKTTRLTKMLAEENFGGVLLNSQHNFAWLTAGGTNGVDTSRDNGAASLLIRNDGKKFLLASRIEMQRMLDEEISEEGFEPVEYAWEDEKASPTFLIDRAVSLLNNGDTLGSDLPLSAKIPVIESHVARYRYQLTDAEIERYRRLGGDAGQAIGDLIKNLAPGESEKEIARRANDALAARGIRPVVTLVAADERLQKYRHPAPTEKRWEKVLMIVVCARRNGLIASLSRIVCAGQVPEDLQRRTQGCARVNAQLLAATQPGASGAELFKAASVAYAKESFLGEEHLHHQGGATGYRTRDWVAHPQSGDKVQLKQAFAWNPSITGTKTEETVIAFADTVEVITASPDFPTISVEVNGREYLSPDILSI
jgi:Xaa-Pro aminopeptidase